MPSASALVHPTPLTVDVPPEGAPDLTITLK
ncbi:MAG: hypothetical protein JWO38_647 [Gemmataceae bacterium]|nr:hypothetical protein [Gemmataceae bacterium]